MDQQGCCTIQVGESISASLKAMGPELAEEEGPVAEHTADVVVVGFGVAGLAAAITACDLGAEVAIIEKMSEREAGGSSRVSGLYWFSPTNVERAEHYLRSLCGEYEVSETLIKAWARETSQNTAWATSLGAQAQIRDAPPEFPDVEGHDCEPGSFHILPGPGDSHLWLFLRQAALQRGIQVLYSTRAVELLQAGGRREVVGVLAQRSGLPLRIDARRAVILASGGFANDPQMARDFLRLPDIHPRGSPASTGDGIRMAQKAGAGLWHMHNFAGAFGLKAPEYAAGFDIAMPSDGWIYVDNEGRRLIDESIPWRHGKIRAGEQFTIFPDRPLHCVFDESTRLAGPLHPPVEKARTSWNRIVESYAWSADNGVEVDRGWIVTGATPRDLARRIGADPSVLERSVERYNAACAAGTDDDFGRDRATLVPLLHPPFYAWTWGPNAVYTCGGPVKDEHARVVDARGMPIPRLYAAGEVSSTYSWVNAWGQMVGDAMAFGRIAGRGAAAEPRLV